MAAGRGAGAPLWPLLCVRQDLFVVDTVPAGMVLTVFVPALASASGGFASSAVRAYAANDQAQFDALTAAGGGAVAWLHPAGAEALRHPQQAATAPPLGLQRQDVDDRVIAEETRDERNGAEMSKLFGRPAWLQDPVRVGPKYQFCLQLQESDLVQRDAAYAGIFRGGSGYFFIDMNCRKLRRSGVAGRFFVQFT